MFCLLCLLFLCKQWDKFIRGRDFDSLPQKEGIMSYTKESNLPEDHIIWELLGVKVGVFKPMGEDGISFIINEGILGHDELSNSFILRMEGGVKLIRFKETLVDYVQMNYGSVHVTDHLLDIYLKENAV